MPLQPLKDSIAHKIDNITSNKEIKHQLNQKSKKGTSDPTRIRSLSLLIPLYS